MLPESDLQDYLAPLTAEQATAIRYLRNLIVQYAPGLSEKVDMGKWFRGLLTYYTPSGHFMFALGPRPKGFTTFHMMPFYGSKVLQEKHSAALKPFLTGKSCIKFKEAEALPHEALLDIIQKGPGVLEEMVRQGKIK
jgi:hypothetical protein